MMPTDEWRKGRDPEELRLIDKVDSLDPRTRGINDPGDLAEFAYALSELHDYRARQHTAPGKVALFLVLLWVGCEIARALL